MHPEVDYGPVQGPVRQGDVLEAISPEAPRGSELMLVLTANCDLARQKNANILTCVPFLAAEDYLLQFQVPKIVARYLKKYVSGVKERLVTLGAADISPSRIPEWVREVGASTALSDLGQDDRELSGYLQAIEEITSDFGTLGDFCASLIVAEGHLEKGRAEASVRKDVVSELKNPFSSPPGDALFISAVSPEHTDGYFAYLRTAQQIPQESVSTAPRSEGKDYRRVGRLQAIYTHHLTQKHGMVFMSIGLPVNYENERDTYVFVQIEEWLNEAVGR